MCRSTFLIALLGGVALASPPSPPPPRVILTILADDIGVGQVGFVSGSPASTGGPGGGSLTPSLDALAADGIRLTNHFTSFWCAPSRAAFLTGRLPVHVQMGQSFPENPSQGIPRNMTSMAALLARCGYETAAVGKWDAGMATRDHTPRGRGFAHSLISFEHMTDRWTQAIWPGGTACTLYDPTIKDLWADDGPARNLNGTAFQEDLHVSRLLSLIANASAAAPLFLYYAPHVAHYPLQVPEAALALFDFMSDDEGACNATVPYVFPAAGGQTQPYRCRAMEAALIHYLDAAIGTVVDALVARGWWNETLMLFASDNGAPLDVAESGGNNYPLRGGKYASWQGGVTTPAFIGGGYVPPARRGVTVDAPVHIADWLATFAGLAGVDPTDARGAASGLPPVDSVDLWPLLMGSNTTSPRQEIPISPDVLVAWPYKLLRGLQDWSGYTGPVYPNASSVAPDASPNTWTFCGGGCLYNLADDNEERTDVAAAHPDIVKALTLRLDLLKSDYYSNNETGTDVCPKGTLFCGCWAAVNVHGGFLGPYQI